MNIQVLSDLHVEVGNPLPTLCADADVVVLAGDFAPYEPERLQALAQALAGAPILYVPGNHEFYGHDIDAALEGMRDTCAELGIELLDRRAIAINGIRFIGATLWTDFCLNGLAEVVWAKANAERSMPDFVGAIRHRDGRFTATEAARRHVEDLRFIEGALTAARAAGEAPVVVTHHAPTPRSIRPWYQGHVLNAAFASDLERFIARHAPPLWIHGHMHDSIDERLGATRVVANPEGYTPTENPLFNPELCVRVDE